MGTELDAQTANKYLKTILPEQLSPQLVRKLPLEFLKKQCAIPITLENGEVAIALSDPLNVEAYDAIMTVLGQPCSRVICPASEIEEAISRCYYQSTSISSDNENSNAQDSPSDHNDVDRAGGETQAEDLLNIANKAPVIKLVNKIFFQAVHSRASDIHIEPYEDEARIRFRVDGVLHDIFTLPKQQIA
ncbi:MAG: ATPase, T2SS/T4P/T4SS family, partial [Planctomycetota bacterium]